MLQQVASKQRRFLAALARLDLEDRVAGVVWVARNQDAAQRLRGVLDGRLERRNLCRELGIGVGHAPRGGEILRGRRPRAVSRDDTPELRKAAPERASPPNVGMDAGVG